MMRKCSRTKQNKAEEGTEKSRVQTIPWNRIPKSTRGSSASIHAAAAVVVALLNTIRHLVSIWNESVVERGCENEHKYSNWTRNRNVWPSACAHACVCGLISGKLKHPSSRYHGDTVFHRMHCIINHRHHHHHLLVNEHNCFAIYDRGPIDEFYK